MPAGQRLPSDAELSTIYKASRNTVREAVRILLNRNLVEKQAKATVVREKIDPFRTVVSVQTGFGGFEGAAYASDVKAQHRSPEVTTPRVEIQVAPSDIAEDLGLAAGTTVVIRHQQRSIDGRLWSMQTSYYPMDFVTNGAIRLLAVEDISEGTRHYLDEALDIKEIGSRDTMTVRAPTTDEADSFNLPDDGRIAVFETRQIGVDAALAPVRVTITIYPADRNEFSMDTGALAKPHVPEERT